MTTTPDFPGPPETTTPATPATPTTRTSRRLVAAVIATLVLSIGAAVFGFAAGEDRQDAERVRTAASMHVRAQRTATHFAETSLRKTRAASRATAQALDVVADGAKQFAVLNDQQLDADRSLQAAGTVPGSVEDYNAAIARSNAILDQYVAAAKDLVDQIEQLEGSTPPPDPTA
jgi:uncharacterized protein HemX